MSVIIGLNKKDGVYYMPGETIKGIVTVDLDEPTPCDSLTLIIEGKCEVEIVETRIVSDGTDSSGQSRSHAVYDYNRMKEIYLSGTISLSEKATLRRGRTVFPFEYSLPTEGLPTNFQASHGTISYEVHVHLQRIQKSDLFDTFLFVVGPLLDLNRVPLADYRPVQYTDEKTIVGCCTEKNGSIRLEIIVPKRVFIPGEFISFKVMTENRSGASVFSGLMRLVLSTKCFAQGSMREGGHVFGQMAGPEVPPNSRQAWEVSNFMIPVLKPVGIPPSDLGGCTIIDAQYILQYYAEIDHKCYRDRFTVDIPLMIGTIALNA